MITALLRILLYLIVIILPVILVTVLLGSSHHTFTAEVGRNLALVAFMIIATQVVLAARIKWIERAFGLDMMLRFHKYMGVTAVVMLLFHPVLISIGKSDWNLITSLDQPWYVTLGKLALALLMINVGLSLFRFRLNYKFERWRLTHDILGPVIIVSVFVHSVLVGHDLQHPFMLGMWTFLLVASLLLFTWHRIWRPWHLKNNPWSVIEVVSESENVWTVKLAPPANGRVFEYLPGQFQFITFYRGRHLPVEEHHWTISSSPSEKGYVSSTIKALGDFTNTINQTRPGDLAAVHAPFGRFSYVLSPPESELVFVAGGIGITPIMSMLRHLRDTGEGRPATLFFGNPDPGQILFKQELAEIESAGAPALTVVHVLSNPDESWEGERGHIDLEKIEKHCGDDLSEKQFFICGPEPLIKSIVKGLREAGVSHRQIRMEIFTLVD